MNVEQSVEWELAGETKVFVIRGKNCPSATLSTTIPIWSDVRSNPATNSQSYGMAHNEQFMFIKNTKFVSEYGFHFICEAMYAPFI
jgi:hypothetical protein